MNLLLGNIQGWQSVKFAEDSISRQHGYNDSDYSNLKSCQSTKTSMIVAIFFGSPWFPLILILVMIFYRLRIDKILKQDQYLPSIVSIPIFRALINSPLFYLSPLSWGIGLILSFISVLLIGGIFKDELLYNSYYESVVTIWVATSVFLWTVLLTGIYLSLWFETNKWLTIGCITFFTLLLIIIPKSETLLFPPNKYDIQGVIKIEFSRYDKFSENCNKLDELEVKSKNNSFDANSFLLIKETVLPHSFTTVCQYNFIVMGLPVIGRADNYSFSVKGGDRAFTRTVDGETTRKLSDKKNTYVLTGFDEHR